MGLRKNKQRQDDALGLEPESSVFLTASSISLTRAVVAWVPSHEEKFLVLWCGKAAQ